jgi:hypothetical protein
MVQIGEGGRRQGVAQIDERDVELRRVHGEARRDVRREPGDVGADLGVALEERVLRQEEPRRTPSGGAHVRGEPPHRLELHGLRLEPAPALTNPREIIAAAQRLDVADEVRRVLRTVEDRPQGEQLARALGPEVLLEHRCRREQLVRKARRPVPRGRNDEIVQEHPVPVQVPHRPDPPIEPRFPVGRRHEPVAEPGVEDARHRHGARALERRPDVRRREPEDHGARADRAEVAGDHLGVGRGGSGDAQSDRSRSRRRAGLDEPSREQRQRTDRRLELRVADEHDGRRTRRGFMEPLHDLRELPVDHQEEAHGPRVGDQNAEHVRPCEDDVEDDEERGGHAERREARAGRHQKPW